MKDNQAFLDILNGYVKSGNKVAEFFHGEKDDILRGVSELVGESEIIYGVDHLNQFDNQPNIQKLKDIPNTHLKKATMHYLPEEISDLDAAIIREFIWTYPTPFNGTENPENYCAINSAIKVGGHLITHLNETVKQNKKMNPENI